MLEKPVLTLGPASHASERTDMQEGTYEKRIRLHKGKARSGGRDSAGENMRDSPPDNDVLDWFRKQVDDAGGGNYQTLVNDAILDHIARRASLWKQLSGESSGRNCGEPDNGECK